MNISNQTQKEIISQFNKLFIVGRYKYLIMYPNGNYVTFNKHDKNKNHKSLGNWQIKDHLQGKYTIGVFAANYISKFICFDTDVPEKTNAKWATYYLIDTLINIGIPKEYIHISISGNKGYHVDIYFNETIQNNLISDFFNLVISKMDLSKIKGQIELRPTNQGLKLPLGINFKNKDDQTNKCWYVNPEDLEPIKEYEYILTIKQLDTDILYNIMLKEKDTYILDLPINTKEAEQIEDSKGFIDQNYKPLKSYQLGTNEKVNIEYVKQIEEIGIKQVGTRHKYLLTLCRYYKYMGMSRDENINSLVEWINRQNPAFYTTKLEQSYKEIINMVNHAYDNDIPFIVEQKEITITYEEMKEIIKAKSKNEKLLLYALLIHSKRYANKNGIFFMSYNQMVTSTGLCEKTVRNNINKLEKHNLISIVERNRKVLGSNGKLLGKRPNKYKLNFINETLIINSEPIIINDELSFNDLLIQIFDMNELKMLLPIRHYRELSKVK